MSITVDNVTYTVPDNSKQIRIPILGASTLPYRRNRPSGVPLPETDEEMQARVQADVLLQQKLDAAIE